MADTRLTKDQVVALQESLNRFFKSRLLGIAPLRADGVYGTMTRKLVKLAKFYLGYLGQSNDDPNEEFRIRLRHPNAVHLSSAARVLRGATRRREARTKWKKEHAHNQHQPGLTNLDGHLVADWIANQVQWARHEGWAGWVVSGYRDPAYSERLCYAMCGAPSCPGTCAGRSSEHGRSPSPADPWAGAVDVSYYLEFNRLMQRCPLRPPLMNALANDKVHFSHSGR